MIRNKRNGQTLLHLACSGYGGKDDLIKFLVDRYPDQVFMTDDFGNSPLHTLMGSLNPTLTGATILSHANPFQLLMKNTSGKSLFETTSEPNHPGPQFLMEQKVQLEEIVQAMRQTLSGIERSAGIPTLVMQEVWTFLVPQAAIASVSYVEDVE